jgi:hypothetical protein
LNFLRNQKEQLHAMKLKQMNTKEKILLREFVKNNLPLNMQTSQFQKGKCICLYIYIYMCINMYMCYYLYVFIDIYLCSHRYECIDTFAHTYIHSKHIYT